MFNRLTKKLKNEEGSITLEFLGVLPLLFLFMLLLWQGVASGVAIIRTQSAVNEATKVYATTHNLTKAEDKAKAIIGTGDIMTFKDIDFIVVPGGSGEFNAEIKVDLSLVFIPEEWRGSTTAIPFQMSVTGKEIW